MYKLIDVLTLLNASFYEEVYLKFIKFIYHFAFTPGKSFKNLSWLTEVLVRFTPPDFR